MDIARTSNITKRNALHPLLVGAFPLCIAALLLAVMASIAFGAADIHVSTVLDSIFAFDAANTNHLIIQTLRLPRMITAVLVGAALGVAGAIMQGLTRNPLADPGLLGIESGAALAVVGGVFLFRINSLPVYAVFAFIGGTLTALTVYALGSMGRGGATPFKLTIAGAALSSLLSSLTTAILMFNQRSLEEVRFWLAGSVAGREMSLVLEAAPFLLGGLVLAFIMGRQITTLSMGEDIARGLGQSIGWTKLFAAGAVVVLAGSAVALAGPIGFIGLIIPHVVRMFAGVDYRWVLPYSALLGATFLVVSDLVGRVLVRPLEMPVGIMTAAIGGPVFIYLVRWKVKR
ncbi:MAG: iron ABC transporter permease [Anaerolineales bacterium]|nr:iron ABC transporter permease [Anaerolineales bacterium]